VRRTRVWAESEAVNVRVVINVHERVIPASVDAVGRMIDDVGPPRDWSRRVVFLCWLVRKSGGNRRRK
jgi:hypothetical protein